MRIGQKGSITVFIVIVLAVMVPLCAIFIDLARLSEGLKIAKSSLKVCTESMLAAYDRQLKEQFSLFAMAPRDVSSMEKELYELLSDNLTPDDSEGAVSDLYGFRVNRVEVIPFYNLSEPYVLEQQVAEFMKYRAPIQAVSEFAQKLSAMMGLMKEADMVNRNMGVDQQLNAFRGDLVHFSLLLRNKMISINDADGSKDLKSVVIRAVRESGKTLEDRNGKAKALVGPVNDAIKAYRAAYEAHEDARKAYEQARDDFNRINESVQTLTNQIADITSDLQNDKLSQSEEDALQKRQSDLEAQRNALDGGLSSAAQEASAKETTLNTCSENLSKVTAALQEKAGELLVHYVAMQDACNALLASLDGLISHLRLHLALHEKALELGNGLVPKLDAIANDTAALESDLQKNDNSGVSSQIHADLQKKVQSLDKELLHSVLTQLNKNRDRLQGWLTACENTRLAYKNALDPLNLETGKVQAIKDQPGKGDTELYSLTSFDGTAGTPASLETAVKDLESKPEMERKGVYSVPAYAAEPKPVETEEKEFVTWYYALFKDLDPALTPPSSEQAAENPELDQARKHISGTAGGIAGLQAEDPGAPGFTLTKDVVAMLSNLPTQNGCISSEDALNTILEQTIQTALEQGPNPLSAEAKGLDTVNEKEKSYFNYELERIKALFETVGNLMANGVESLMKSLYMNEYILSAFKNATYGLVEREYDIGWDRPMDTTAFKKGEVEYVIFGNASEKENIAAAQRSLFAIRLVFNLLHVYTDPPKISKTFSIASAIAGWTIFGVPVVQNFLLITWAAFESYIDSEKLMKGESVPLIKTAQSWFLDENSLKDYLLNKVLADLKQFANSEASKAVDEASAYLEDTVRSFINGQVDELFLTVEDTYDALVDEAKGKIDETFFSGANLTFTTASEIENLEDFLDYLKGALRSNFDAIVRVLREQGSGKLAEYKQCVKDYLCNLIFRSQAYVSLKAKVKQLAQDLIDKGINAVSEKINEVLGSKSGLKSGGSNVLGRLVMMNYSDYLRLMLLAVSPQDKALRTADLIQLDMYATAPENSHYMSEYYTGLYIKAYIDINCWFLPDKLVLGDRPAMMVVEWSQGY